MGGQTHKLERFKDTMTRREVIGSAILCIGGGRSFRGLAEGFAARPGKPLGAARRYELRGRLYHQHTLSGSSSRGYRIGQEVHPRWNRVSLLCGSVAKSGEIVRTYLQSNGFVSGAGHGATVIGSSLRAPVRFAAFANASVSMQTITTIRSLRCGGSGLWPVDPPYGTGPSRRPRGREVNRSLERISWSPITSGWR